MRAGKSKGFTLIELLIVIAIIGILAAVLIPQLLRARNVAVDRAAEAYVNNVYTAANAYLAEFLTATATSTVALDNACADGVTYGAYSAEQPTFTVDSCTVTAPGGNSIAVSLTYQGGTTSPNTVTLP